MKIRGEIEKHKCEGTTTLNARPEWSDVICIKWTNSLGSALENNGGIIINFSGECLLPLVDQVSYEIPLRFLQRSFNLTSDTQGFIDAILEAFLGRGQKALGIQGISPA